MRVTCDDFGGFYVLRRSVDFGALVALTKMRQDGSLLAKHLAERSFS